MQWFRGGLVFQAHRLLYQSTQGLRVMKKKKKKTHSNLTLAKAATVCRIGRSCTCVWGLGLGIWGLGFEVRGSTVAVFNNVKFE